MIRTILIDTKTVLGTTAMITAADVKTYLGIASNVHDTLLGNLIKSALDEFENLSKFAVRPQTITATWESVNEYAFLPISNVVSITSTKDLDDVDISSPEYKGEIHRKVVGNFTSGVKVVYDAGYDSADDVPFDIKEAIWNLVGEKFEYRTGLTVENVKILPNGWRSTALKYRRTWVM